MKKGRLSDEETFFDEWHTPLIVDRLD